jgi:hypothetical protein
VGSIRLRVLSLPLTDLFAGGCLVVEAAAQVRRYLSHSISGGWLDPAAALEAAYSMCPARESLHRGVPGATALGMCEGNRSLFDGGSEATRGDIDAVEKRGRLRPEQNWTPPPSGRPAIVSSLLTSSPRVHVQTGSVGAVFAIYSHFSGSIHCIQRTPGLVCAPCTSFPSAPRLGWRHR